MFRVGYTVNAGKVDKETKEQDCNWKSKYTPAQIEYVCDRLSGKLWLTDWDVMSLNELVLGYKYNHPHQFTAKQYDKFIEMLRYIVDYYLCVRVMRSNSDEFMEENVHRLIMQHKYNKKARLEITSTPDDNANNNAPNDNAKMLNDMYELHQDLKATVSFDHLDDWYLRMEQEHYMALKYLVEDIFHDKRASKANKTSKAKK